MIDFEQELRDALAALAREAVPATERPIADGARLEPSFPVRGVRRALVTTLAVVLVGAGVAFALSTRRRADNRPHVESGATVTALPPSPLGPRDEQVAVFTGRAVIVWGGRYQRNSTPVTAAPSRPGTRTALGDGAIFDLATRQWRTIPAAPISARWSASVAWTGTEMLVVGGMSDADGSGISFPADGAAFDPQRNRWRRLPEAPICEVGGHGVWTGAQLVVGGACPGRNAGFRVAALDPAHDRWTELPAPHGAFQLFGVNGAVDAWGGVDHGERFDTASRRWVPLDARPAHAFGQETVAVDFAVTAVAVIGPRSSTEGGVAIDIFDPDTPRPTHFEVPAVGPVEGSVVAVGPDHLVWNQGVGLAWFENGGRSGVVTRGPVSLDRINETLLAVGDREVFVWGGQSIPNGRSGTSQPSNDGAIVEIP